jgi:hypothetical protein
MINNVLRQDLKTLGTVVFDHKPDRARWQGLVTAILSGRQVASSFAPDNVIVEAALPELWDVSVCGYYHNTRVYRWEYGAVQLGRRPERTDALRRALEDSSTI